MTITRKVFRLITFGLFTIAILSYYLPALIGRGYFGVVWLAIGVVHTVAFCAMFFRDSRTRTGISIAIMVVTTLWSFIMLLLNGLLLLLLLDLGLNSTPGVVYSFCSMMASIFALTFPRKYIEKPDEPVDDSIERSDFNNA